VQRYRYLEACDYLKAEHGNEWPVVLRESYLNPQYRKADIHEAIFNLDCRIVASLNFDRIYENYATSVSEKTLTVKNYYDAEVEQTVSGSDRYIIKPHGSIDTISKLIFTLDDYAKARVQYANFYELITALLHTHVFLCVGCGLSDPDMQLMFEDYRYKRNDAPHYMTLPTPISLQEMSLIQKTRGLNVLTYSSRDRHRELTESLKTLGLEVAEARDEMATLQSW
jgi:hypothetical protein